MQAISSMQVPTGVGAMSAHRALMPLARDRRPLERRLALKKVLGSRIPATVPTHHAHAWSPIPISAVAAAGPAQEVSARPMNIVFVSAEVCVHATPAY